MRCYANRRLSSRLLRVLVTLLVIGLLIQTIPLTITKAVPTAGQNRDERSNGQEQKVKPLPVEKGKPQMELPDLDERGARWESRRDIRPASPSTVRSKNKPVREVGKHEAEADQKSDVIGQPSEARGRGSSTKERARHHRLAPVEPLVPQGGATTSERALARLNPFNQTGNQLAARDCEFSLPLLNLPGRAGLDLNLTLSYSSLVWTPAGSSLYFDEDKADISPGFQLGFPRIENVFFDSQASANARLLVAGTGRRTELRQVGATNVYQSADSSYLQLIENDNTLTLRATDGTQLTYAYYLNANVWVATKVKDRNGNYLTITNNSLGDIQTITDTLGRQINFNYDGNANLQSITQTWNNGTHIWATFGWGEALTLNVSTLSGVVGAYTGQQIPVLRQVNLMDGSYYVFDYAPVGQVSVIHRFRNLNAQSTYTVYEYDNGGSDCPRLNATDLWAENWSAANGVPYYVTALFTLPGDGSHQMTMTDGTAYREYYGSGWQNGLVTQTQVYAGGLQKWTTASYTQDNTGVTYQTNPRVTETNVYDINGNHRRTAIDYDSYWMWGLPHAVHEYDGNGTELRRTYTEYNLGQAYLDTRIIGLTSETRIYDPAAGWFAKTTYEYDGVTVDAQANSAPQHDPNITTPRGNLTSVSRWNVTYIDDAAQKLTSSMTYNAAGSLLTVTDAASHTNSIGYGDSFSDNGNGRGTYAYPTTMTDGDGYTSTIQYNYDFGAQTRMEGPPPGSPGQFTHGLIQTFTYDSAVRPSEITNLTNGAVTHFSYGPNYVESWSSVNSNFDNYAVKVFDGLLRVMAVAGYHPGSTGGFWGQWTRYDQMGRVSQQTNPTEMTGGWVPTGDDSGWQYNNPTEYDWKGRVLKSYNVDGSFKDMSYSGCGCAGGQVVLIRDEVGRRQKVYADVLGRQRKVETLYEQPKNQPLNDSGAVYATTVNTYNALDLPTVVRQWAGAENGGGAHQDTYIGYDGYGRLLTRFLPEQQVDANNPASTDHTTWSYNYDDTINSVKDARGAIATYGYNSRRLVTSINYSAPSGIASTPNVSFTYDAAGNRTSMNDGSGTMTYSYDQLSRLTSETKAFSGVTGTYALSYQYNLIGNLKKITDPTNAATKYNYDSTGRVTSVTAENTLVDNVSTYASSLTYRAWGGLKDIDYGNGAHSHLNYNSRLLPTSLALSNVLLSPYYQPTTMTWDYDYFDDGRTHHAFDLNDNHFDKAQEYDQVGRIKETYTGLEANGLSATSPIPDSPYRQTIQYDVWNNMTAKSGRLWRQPMSDSFAYTNNRGPAWRMQYDADGNMTQVDAKFHIYDAANQQAQYIDWAHTVGGGQTGHDPAPALEIAQTYDGSNQPAKRIETRRVDELIGEGPQTNIATTATTTYYLYSTMLGGSTVAEFDANGLKTAGYVYANGQRLAKQTVTPWYSYVTWEHPNAGSNSRVETNSSRGVTRQELDPTGAEVGVTDPYVANPNPNYSSIKGTQPLFIDGGDPFDYSGGYAIDGMPVSRSEFTRRGEAETLNVTFSGLISGTVPLVSFGLGIFGYDRPDGWHRDEEGLSLDWGTATFSFGGGAQAPRPPAKFTEKQFKDCLQKHFTVQLISGEVNGKKSPAYGIDRSGGFFSGMRPDGRFISVQTNTTSYSKAGIKDWKLDQGNYGGFTENRHPETNFVASDFAQTASPEMLRAVWVHELGNSLAELLSAPGRDLHFKAKNSNLRRWDGDSGSGFEECVYGGKVMQDAAGYVFVTNDPWHP